MNSFVVRVLFYCIGAFCKLPIKPRRFVIIEKSQGPKNSTDTRNAPEWGQSQAGSDRLKVVTLTTELTGRIVLGALRFLT